MSEALVSRFMRFVARPNGPDGCWLWQGSIGTKGYARFGLNGRARHAHVVSYELLVGPVPEGLDLDHLCRVRRRVNPDHLEPVPHVVNVHRGVGPTAVNAAKTHCIHGHPLSGENLITRKGGMRGCRTCQRSAARKCYALRSRKAGS